MSVSRGFTLLAIIIVETAAIDAEAATLSAGGFNIKVCQLVASS